MDMTRDCPSKCGLCGGGVPSTTESGATNATDPAPDTVVTGGGNGNSDATTVATTPAVVVATAHATASAEKTTQVAIAVDAEMAGIAKLPPQAAIEQEDTCADQKTTCAYLNSKLCGHPSLPEMNKDCPKTCGLCGSDAREDATTVQPKRTKRVQSTQPAGEATTQNEEAPLPNLVELEPELERDASGALLETKQEPGNKDEENRAVAPSMFAIVGIACAVAAVAAVAIFRSRAIKLDTTPVGFVNGIYEGTVTMDMPDSMHG